MIIRIKNKTATDLNLNAAGTQKLLANEAKVCFYNKPILSDQTVLRALLKQDKIEFLDEENISCVHYDINENNTIYGENLLIDVFGDIVFNSGASNIEQYYMGCKVGKEIRFLIQFMFFKEKDGVGLLGYNAQDWINALKSKNVFDLLDGGLIKQAGTGINNITSDSFFTTNRKTKLKEICDSVVLI